MGLLPFINGSKSASAARYEKRLAEYREALENYKKCIIDYSGRLEGFDKRSMDNQLSIVQTALDLTYLKEQNDVIIELLEDKKEVQDANILKQLDSILATMIETNYKLEGMDKDVVNRISSTLMEIQKQTLYQCQQLEMESAEKLKKMSKSVSSGKVLLWIVLLFQIISMSGIAYLILESLDLLPF